jgi:phosphoglycolate phosphatase
VVELAKPVVVLFDVDETLVHTGGAGARSWDAAFQKIYGRPADIGAHSSAGETDPQVGRSTFKAVMERDPSDDELDRVYAQYLLHLADDILVSANYRVLDGARDTLEALSEAGILLGIISGAMEGAARTKLVPADLNRYFIFGGYGSDSPVRADIVKLAIAKASTLHAGLRPDQVVVVGDTPRDVTAGNDAGAVSVGVATGKYSVDELAEAGATHVLSSLREAFPDL